MDIFEKIFLSLIFALFLQGFCLTPLAYSDEEMDVLRLFYKEEDLVVSPTRHEKPLSQAAEDITVVTSGDIELMNAHTLADVLFHVTGVQIDILSTPGFPSPVHIQGSEFRHVLVALDGIPLNNLSNNIADIGALPARNIERVEIVKGPASSSWGSSLGGMINVITKSPSEKSGGTLSASHGEKNTGGYEAELSGTEGRLGYYLFAGRLQSDGLRPNTHVSDNSLYAKLVFDVSENVDAFLTLGYNEGTRGLSEAPAFGVAFDNEHEYYYATLGVNARVLGKGKLSLSLRALRQDLEQVTKQLNTIVVLDTSDTTDETYGGSLKFSYHLKPHTFVIGSDVDNGTLTSNKISNGEQGLDKWAVYANDTIAFSRLSFTPGIRYDHTSTTDDFTSPSLGITYSPHESTVLRATVARGFSIPPLQATFGTGSLAVPVLVPNPDLEVEQVWSYQAGIETSALKYLVLKSTVFRHDVRDAIINEQLSPTSFRAVNRDKIRRQGIETEIKTAPFHNVSLLAGYNYMDIEDRRTGKTISGLPRYTWDVGAEYRAERIKGMLRGHYIRWNGTELGNGRDNTFVWDLNLSGTLHRREALEVDLFAAAHNLFNASQYPNSNFRNPRRWVEAGLRVIF